jgi:23S rRNA pseudouridine1911/1915/1917 synthase
VVENKIPTPETIGSGMSEKFERVVLQITPELAGIRIDKALASVSQIATRSQAARLLQAGRVRIAGKVLKPSYQTALGDAIDIDVPVVVTQELQPYDFPLDIAYEDADLIVVNKPAGLVVHPACGHAQDTLVNALLHHTSDLSMGFNERRPGLVHRIDKGTSGLLVIAKHDQAQRFLAMQFQRKTTHRLYRAIAFGRFKETEGTIRSFLKRHPEDRKRVASVPFADANVHGADAAEAAVAASSSQRAGKLAVTHYRVTHTHPTGISLVELRLETGRTHQIRVHLSEAGHPIVGDVTYGASKRLKTLKSVHLRKMIEEMPRFALHAMELGFVHPSTGKFMLFRAPWAPDLLPLVEHGDFPQFHERHEVEILEAANARASSTEVEASLNESEALGEDDDLE